MVLQNQIGCLPVKNREDFSIRTTGINPYYQTVEEIQEALQKELVPNLPQMSLIKAVYFYGAGCELPAQQAVVSRAISPLFNNCSVHVDSDLIAAARSVLGDEAGICCISGTGSNTCYYDGKRSFATSTLLACTWAMKAAVVS